MDPPTALPFLFPGSEPASTPHPLSFTHQIWSGTPSGGSLSLQQAATLDVLHLVAGAKDLDGLVVNQGPEVVEGDVLAALHVHLLQEAVQPTAALRNLRQETGSDAPSYRCVTGKKTAPTPGDSLGCAAVLLAEPPVMSSVRSHLGHGGQLLGHQALELGLAQGGAVVSSLMELCDQRVDGQLQI